MKKILVVLLVFVFLAATVIVPVTAAGPNYGNVKKVNESDVDMSNANKDAAFAAVEPVAILNRFSGEPDGPIATGLVWMLWSDAAVYVYAEINDSTIYDLPEGTGNAWETDSFEIFLSMEGTRGDGTIQPLTGNSDRPMQYRVDRNNIPSSWADDMDWDDGFLVGTGNNIITGVGDNANYFQWATRQEANGSYAVKLRIFAHGPQKSGQVGVNFQINDRDEFGDAIPGQVIWAEGSIATSWEAIDYGYVTFIDELAYIPPPPVEENAPEAAGGGEEAPEPPPVQRPTAPTTGDAGVIALIALMALAAAGVVAFRKKAVK